MDCLQKSKRAETPYRVKGEDRKTVMLGWVGTASHLELGLRVNVTEGGVGVEGGVRMIPAHNVVAPAGQLLRSLGLRHRIHLTLHPRAQAVARFCGTDLRRITLIITVTIHHQRFTVTSLLSKS